MSVVFTGTNQGRFVANGSAVFIPLPSGADYCHILNETQAYSGAVDVNTGVIFDWYGGDAIGRGTVQYITEDAPTVLNISQIAAGSGFYFINTTNTNNPPIIVFIRTPLCIALVLYALTFS